jgi:hypothetical protein
VNIEPELRVVVCGIRIKAQPSLVSIPLILQIWGKIWDFKDETEGRRSMDREIEIRYQREI